MGSGETGAAEWQYLREAMGLVVRPITVWPGRLRTERKASPFSSGLPMTLIMLKTELEKIGARGVVLEVAIGPGDVRQDGLPYARAKLAHPGVILSFTTRVGAFRKAYDGFNLWHDNLRALAENLKHLRLACAYGAEPDFRCYGGWAVAAQDGWRGQREPEKSAGPKPPPQPEPAEKTLSCTDEEMRAADFFSRRSGMRFRRILTDRNYMEQATRAAQIALHPDRHQGEENKRAAHDLFIRIAPYAEVLRRRFK